MVTRFWRRVRIPLYRDVSVIVCLALLFSSYPSSLKPRAAAGTVGDRPEQVARNLRAEAAAERKGTLIGLVVNASNDEPLAGIQVVAAGALDELPPYRTFLPVVAKRRSVIASDAGPTTGQAATAASLASLSSRVVLTTTTGADGSFSLAAPAGTYTLTLTLASFGLDRRSTTVRANEVSRVADVRLHALDPVVAPVGAGGGKITNSLANTSLEFPAGALSTTQQTRVTFLANQTLPGYFADGSVPMGFAGLEPEGLVFPQGKEVLWTVAYTGTLPVGTDTLCYWWDGTQNRWRDPVPGKVVDAGGGQKALQARVTHFSTYGHALPGIAGQQPGGGDASITTANAGEGGSQTQCPGCEINVGTGSVSEEYTFPSVSSRGLAVILGLRYSSSNDTSAVTARVPFTITSQTPARAEWRLDFQGKTYTGEGYDARTEWDTRNGLGQRVAPGLYAFNAWETFYYDSGARPTLAVSGTVEVRRGDISPFGFNWLSSYDTVLVNKSSTVTIIQGDGQYLTYVRQGDDSYSPPAGDTGRLTLNPDGTWTRTSKYGMRESFNALGRLTRVQDPNDNVLSLAYEPSGAALPAGAWGLTTRVKSITDSSGRSTSLAYGADGYVSRVTDAAGRTYTLTHDDAGNLTGITGPLGHAVSYQYDANHLLVGITEPGGAHTTIGYDGQRRITSHTDPLGYGRSAGYGDNTTAWTNEVGVVTTYEANSYGAVTRSTNEIESLSYEYDAARQLTRGGPPAQSFAYDQQGNLTGLNNFTTSALAYEPAHNQVISTTNGAGHSAQYGYDGRGNLIAITNSIGQVSRFQYDSAGQLVSSTDALNRATQFEYDAYGNLTRLTDPLGRQSTLTYDTQGNLTRQTDPASHTLDFTYDTLDRPTALTDALGRSMHYEYDAAGNLTRATDARGHSTTYGYDAATQLTSVTDPLGHITRYEYDPTGALSASVNASGDREQLAYDAAGRLTAIGHADGSRADFTYNANLDLTGYTDAATSVTYTYASALPGLPDTIVTGVRSNPLVQSTISYDYVEPADGGAVAAPAVSADAKPQPALLPEAKPAASPVSALPVVPAAGAPPSTTATNACGTITANTTWNLAGSPYVINDCSTYVNAGVTLTIEPGVVVKFGWKWDALYVDGRLSAQGTAGQPIYFTSLDDDSVGGDTNGNGSASQPVPGDWNGVRFRETSTGSVLDHVVVRYGGADGATSGIYAYIAQFTITHSTIAQTKGHGLYLETTLPPVLSNNTFISNTGIAVNAILNGAGPSITLSGNTATGNGVNGFRVYGTFAGAGTWTGDPGFPFLVLDGDLQVQPGAVLTLSPGTVVKLGNYVWDSVIVHGRLVAQGTAGQPITFTSVRDDSVGGDTNSDGGATPAAPGDWNGVQFRNTSAGSVLDHVVIRYGGSYANTAGVQANTGAFTLANSTIAQTRGYGLYMDGGLPPSLSNNTFISNTLAAVRAYFNTVGASIQVSGNSAWGNGMNGFQVAGVINANGTWTGDPNLPFIIPDGNLQVASGATLTLAPGTIVKFEHAFVTFQVDGALDARGTAAQPITFTSLRDDSVGGDTNGDGSVSRPAPGDWNLMRFNNLSQQSTLEYNIIRYGGGTGWQLALLVYTPKLALTHSTIANTRGGALGIENASPVVEDNTFQSNERGVHAWANSQPVLRRNRFVGNTVYGVRNDSSGVIIDAQQNWWGSPTGPYDPSDDRASGGWYNPAGKGNPVTDRVDYRNWQMISGLVYGTSIATGQNPVQSMRYGYDALDRITQLTATGPAAFTMQYTYDAGGRLTASAPASSSPGIATSYEYDAADRLTRMVNRAGSVTLGDIRTTYDQAGNILTATDGSGATTYAYDALYQMTSASGPSFAETYSYDEVGNRLSRNGVTYTYNAGDQLVSASDGSSFTYDNNGNLRTRTQGGATTTYTWDSNDRLVRVDLPNGSYVAYTYDSMDNRVSRRGSDGSMTYYVYDGLDVVQEVNTAGAVLANYVYDGLDHPLSMSRGGITTYFVYDGQGNVTALVNTAGAVVASYRYDPWGNTLSVGGSQPTLVNPFRFSGREWDAETGLYYFRARYYDPGVGRFVSTDPAALLPGISTYAYVGNNPVGRSDPLGLYPQYMDNWYVRQAISLMEQFHRISPAAVAGRNMTDHMIVDAMMRAIRDVPAAQKAETLQYLGRMSKAISSGQQFGWVAPASSALRTTVINSSVRTTIATPIRSMPARILLGPGRGKAFARFASFAKPPPGLIARFGGTIARFGGRAVTKVALRAGARLIPIVGTAMLVVDVAQGAYALYKWWRSPCP
ncbi:MAG: right-handed parallel beta-helix repeat-containing protein [Chloroflexi bacterium]|nr:right-handed parallel beta-helix repeat-containing protein [Chloroflexota bacterium]